MTRTTLPLALLFTALGANAFAQDSDADGVPDTSDAFPCDPAVASVVYAPGANTWQMLVFEDQWPAHTDLDFNDVVVRTHYRIYGDAQGRATKVQAFFDPVALGGLFDNGLAVQLPAPAAGATVRRRVGAGAWAPITVEPDANLTAILSANLRELFGGQAGPLNAIPNAPRVNGQLLEIEVDFATPVALDAGLAPFDVFIFRAGDFGHQIHFPQYRGTQAMRSSLFNTGTDASTPSRAFVHFTGVPFALNLQNTTVYPHEGVAISAVFPNILTFASSGGTSAQDFYLTNIVSASGHDISANPVPPSTPAAEQCTYHWVTGTYGACGQATASNAYGAWGVCTGGTGSWLYGGFGACSASAVCSGTGTQTRSSVCNFDFESGSQTRSATCNWDVDSGLQTRTVTCTDFRGTTLPDSACIASKPASSRACTPTGPATCAPPVAQQPCTPSDPAVCGTANTTQSCSSPSGTRSCAIANGSGSQTCGAGSTTWGTCTVTSCNSGYQISGNSCVPTTPCRSGYWVQVVQSNAGLAACGGQKNAALDSGLNLICCAGNSTSCTANGRTYSRGGNRQGSYPQYFYSLNCQ